MTTEIMGKKLRLSPTKMNALDECARKFKEQLTGERSGGTIYTETGTAAHTVLEAINKGEVLTPAERGFRFREELIKLCIEKDMPLIFTGGFTKSKVAIMDYVIPTGYVLFAAEGKQVLDFPEYEFSFIPDVIYINETEKKAIIRDYKSGSTKPTAMQIYLYGWACLQKYPELRGYEVIGEFHMLQTDSLISYALTPAVISDIEAYMARSIPMIQKMIRLDYWEETPGKQCHFCDFRDCESRPVAKE